MSHSFTLHAPRRVLTAIAFAAAATSALSACSTTEPTASPSEPAGETAATDASLLTDHGLDGLTTREVIDSLDAVAVADRSTDLMASVRPHQLLLSDDQRELALDMPADAFYVSIAPYVDDTHDCYFHSLTTCKGELQNTQVHVVVTDKATGEALVDETRTTFDNGFVGLWLPRDIDAAVTIEHDGRSASSDLSTHTDDDATCVTTMQLT